MILVLSLECAVLHSLLLGLQNLFGIYQVLWYVLLALSSRVSHGLFPLLFLLLSRPLHLYGQQLPSRPDCILPPALAARFTVADGLTLEGGGAAIENEDGLDADEQQLADPAEETDDVAVAQGVSFLVAHGFEELVDPDGGIHGEPLLVQGLNLDGPRAGLQHSPEAGDTHCGSLPAFSIYVGDGGCGSDKSSTGSGCLVISRQKRVAHDVHAKPF